MNACPTESETIFPVAVIGVSQIWAPEGRIFEAVVLVTVPKLTTCPVSKIFPEGSSATEVPPAPFLLSTNTRLPLLSYFTVNGMASPWEDLSLQSRKRCRYHQWPNLLGSEIRLPRR